jgi:hypothetical protein
MAIGQYEGALQGCGVPGFLPAPGGFIPAAGQGERLRLHARELTKATKAAASGLRRKIETQRQELRKTADR